MGYFLHTASDVADAATSAHAEDLAAVARLIDDERNRYRGLLRQAGHPSGIEQARHVDRLSALNDVRRALLGVGGTAGA